MDLSNNDTLAMTVTAGFVITILAMLFYMDIDSESAARKEKTPN
jgi:hypothetical protein